MNQQDGHFDEINRAPGDQSSLPDLDGWMDEIEEFCGEITTGLNEIAESLGDRSVSLEQLPTIARARAESGDTRSSANLDAEPLLNQASEESVDEKNFLDSLKERLARLKSESSSTEPDAGSEQNEC